MMKPQLNKPHHLRTASALTLAISMMAIGMTTAQASPGTHGSETGNSYGNTTMSMPMQTPAGDRQADSRGEHQGEMAGNPMMGAAGSAGAPAQGMMGMAPDGMGAGMAQMGMGKMGMMIKKRQAMMSRFDLIEARLAKIEVLLERLSQR